MGLLAFATANAQQTPIDYDRLAANCQLVVEANNIKNAKQAELEKLTSELDNLKQQWRDICYTVIDDQNSTAEDFQILIKDTFEEIDGNDLITALNNAAKGGEVKLPESTPAPVARQTPKPQADKPSKETQKEKPVKESPREEDKSEKDTNVQKGITDSDTAVVDPTKQGNTSEKVSTQEKKTEEKKEQSDDEIVKSKFKKNRNNKE